MVTEGGIRYCGGFCFFLWGNMKLFLSLFLSAISFSGFAQNLVPNPSFELEGPTAEFEQFYTAWVGQDWQCCWGGIRYGTNYKKISSVHEPKVKAHSGISYVGVRLYRIGDTARDFLSVKLNEPIIKDEEYRVGFYFILDKSSIVAINNIGIHFSASKITCDSIHNIKNPSLEYNPGYYLNDSINWMRVSFTYKAKGDEQYLQLGRYKPNLINDTIGSSFPPSRKKVEGAYYLIDDVFVIPEKDYAPDISKANLEKGKSITLNNLFFETDKYELLPASFTELDKLVEIMKSNLSTIIVIRGYTDNAGTEEHNQQLSLDRANEVMNYLIKKGIAANRLSTWGFGSSRPLASNITEEGRTMNRRVEILIK